MKLINCPNQLCNRKNVSITGHCPSCHTHIPTMLQQQKDIANEKKRIEYCPGGCKTSYVVTNRAGIDYWDGVCTIQNVNGCCRQCGFHIFSFIENKIKQNEIIKKNETSNNHKYDWYDRMSASEKEEYHQKRNDELDKSWREWLNMN